MKKKNKKLVPIVVVVVIIGVLIWYFTRDKSYEIIDGNGNGGNGNGGNGNGGNGNGGNGNGGNGNGNGTILISNGEAMGKAQALVDDIWGLTVAPVTKRLWNELMDYDDDNFAKIVRQADNYIYTKSNPWVGSKPNDFYELVDGEISPRLNSGNITNRINRLGI